MFTILTVAALALSPIRTLPAYADYRTAVERCTPDGSWSEHQARDLRTAFAIATPDRYVTAAVEEQISVETDRMRTCLDDVAARVNAAMARPDVQEVFGSADPAPWLDDVAKRRRNAEREVRDHFTALGFRPSDAPRAAQAGFFYCQIDFYENAPDGGAGEHRSRIVSRIEPETGDPAAKARFLADFHTRAHQGDEIEGRSLITFHEEATCHSRPTMAEITAARGKAARNGG